MGGLICELMRCTVLCKKIDPLLPKKMKLWRLLKIEGFVLIYILPPFGPIYMGERRTTFAKAHGLEMRCLYGEHVGEHIVNSGNIL
jgi:hypothetical protein